MSIECCIPFKKNATGYKQKSKTISRYQTTNLLKTFLFLVSMKGQGKDESVLVTKFVGIIVTIMFI